MASIARFRWCQIHLLYQSSFEFSTRVCIGRNFSSNWGDICVIQHSLPPQFLILGWLCLPGQASPRLKIVAAMNAKLHISPQSEEKFLPTKTLVGGSTASSSLCQTRLDWGRLPRQSSLSQQPSQSSIGQASLAQASNIYGPP